MQSSSQKASSRSVLRSEGVWLFAVRLGAVGLTFLVSVVLARSLGASDFGTYAYAFAILSLLAVPVQLGLPALVLREVPRAAEREDMRFVRSLLLWGVKRIGLMTLFCVGLILFLVFMTPIFSVEVSRTLTFGLPLVPLLALLTLGAALLRGFHNIALGQTLEELLRPVLFLGALLVIWVWEQNMSAVVAMLMHAIAAGVACVIGYGLLRKKAPREFWQVSDMAPEKGWNAAIFSLSLLAALQLVSQSTDILMLGFLKTTQDVGIYRVALSGMALGIFGLRLFDILFGPRLAVLVEQNDMEGLSELTRKCAIFSFAASLPVAVIFWFFGTQIIGFIFGPEFSGAASVLSLLLTAQLAVAALGPAATLLVLNRQEKLTVRVLFGAVLFNIILNVALIPTLGIYGAALATAITLVGKAVALWVLARRHVGVNTSILAMKVGE